MTEQTQPLAAKPYRVLALKYRPSSFDDLIGQDVLVRTLAGAFASGKIAGGYMLTGIRGVGKTTSARIIARALNCERGVSAQPCGQCETCRAIAAGRHLDVREIDAASNTGVDNVRELIDSTQYLPTYARFKVFILDEVHMLSKAAFNALLKTLEEPPPHVKFIFATTEIRKVPITILSRTQRFDLKRVEPGTLQAYFMSILEKEGIGAEPEGVAMIARAADGSVRDGLSLLDQAILHGAGAVKAESVRAMIGLSDRTLAVRLFGLVLAGDTTAALACAREMYALGAEPAIIIGDLLELDYKATRAKLGIAEPEAAAFAGASHADLALVWQACLKGLDDLKIAPDALQALEMLIVRLIYMTGKTEDEPASAAPAPRPQAAAAPATPAAAMSFPDFAAVADHADKMMDKILAFNLKNALRVAEFADGAITLALLPSAPRGLTSDLAAKLREWTGKEWQLTVINAPSENPPMTIGEQIKAREAKEREEASADPAVAQALALFGGAEIARIIPAADEAGADDSAD
ncbi:hypothetical protein FACS1894186_0500 [Alphaproteobacteria bacterium]|nr:hypothetical protein FACS1894186_0500 [Alphaproteobacteria bacterium]